MILSYPCDPRVDTITKSQWSKGHGMEERRHWQMNESRRQWLYLGQVGSCEDQIPGHSHGFWAPVARSSWSLEDTDRLSACLCCKASPCDCYWVLFALHGEVWLLFFVPCHSIAPAFVFFTIDYACSSFSSGVNDLDAISLSNFDSNL